MDVIANGVTLAPALQVQVSNLHPLEGDCFGTKRLAMTQNRDLLNIP